MIRRVVWTVAVLVSMSACWYGWRVVHTQPGTVVIASGDSISIVAEKLSHAGIVRSPTVFKFAFKIFGANHPVYPGVVSVPSDCSLWCVVKQIAHSQADTRITVTEGMDVRAIAALVEKNGLASRDAWYAFVGEPARFVQPVARTTTSTRDFVFLHDLPARVSYEGFLFPDTYDVRTTGSLEEFVAQMLKNFDRKVTPEMHARAAAHGHTLYEVVTMASILEKEVRGMQDKQVVADILWRRSARGMPLQVDASVQYVSGHEGRFTTAADRGIDSLWNTYKYHGLPLGPISNPGIEAIEAALNPTPNTYWFYLTGADGTVHYAHTLAEHVANKKFLQP